MMTTDPTMLYASFPPSSCDFRSTIVSKQNKKIVFKTLIFSFFKRKIQWDFIQCPEKHYFFSVCVFKSLFNRDSFI
jgi:hypothetical protein